MSSKNTNTNIDSKHQKIESADGIEEKEIDTVDEKETDEVKDQPEEKETDEVKDQPEEKEKMIGVVRDCFRLNIRKEPKITSEIISKVDVFSKLIINENESTYEWFSILTESGINGFCMKKFVAISQ